MVTEHRNYITVGGAIVAVRTHRSDNAHTTRYFHRDHLGSTSVITNASAGVDQRLSYDAWGKRRLVSGLDGSEPAPLNPRGYTGHEHLDNVGFVHMNGRVYEPTLGRFGSADPFLDGAGDGQSFNRYAYVKNNPLSVTDPSGHFSLSRPLSGLMDFLRSPNLSTHHKLYHSSYATQALDGFARRYPQETMIIATVIAGAFTAGTGSYVVAAYAAVGVGSTAAGVAYANGAEPADYWRAGLTTAATSMAFFAVGSNFSPAKGAEWTSDLAIKSVLAHAAVGCASAAANGGDCAAGAASAAAGKAVTILGQGQNGMFVAALAGGAASELAGGKFANGAATAAMGYLFNQLLTGARLGAAAGGAACGPVCAVGGIVIGGAIASAAGTATADPPFTYYHGTSDASAVSIQTQGLNIDAALPNRGPDGLPGFYVTPSHMAAAYFAEERYPGTVLRVTMTGSAQSALGEAGAIPSTMYYGRGQTPAPQLFIPPTAFPVFNSLYRSGSITITPEKY